MGHRSVLFRVLGENPEVSWPYTDRDRNILAKILRQVNNLEYLMATRCLFLKKRTQLIGVTWVLSPQKLFDSPNILPTIPI